MAKNEKSKGEQLQEKLLMKTENAGILMEDTEIKKAYDFCEPYLTFLDSSKTEREAVCSAIEILKKNGYKELKSGKKYKAGEKVYLNNRGKMLLFATIGTRSFSDGVKIVASHVDSPRIDLKQRPLYEEAQLAYFKTHYYGGVRKYQWVTIPLALHGTIIRQDGSSLDVAIGEQDNEPIFMINDILPHLSGEQNKRTLSEGIKGEELNVLIGSLPFKDDKASERVKLNVMRILNEKYGIVEADLRSADLALVPAFKARSMGFDQSMIASYGHDDRVCAYTSLMAMMEVKKPAYTIVNILADREEIGSYGNTGLQSRELEYFLADLAQPYGVEVRDVLRKSECLSADVCNSFDPSFPDVGEKRNVAYLGYGAAMMKYSGARGKSGTSEASAEFIGKVRQLFDDNGVIWQTCELGKVDQGGGGTVAMYVAQLGVDVVDLGVPVLSMHAPYEVVNKLDVYTIYKAFVAFYSDKR